MGSKKQVLPQVAADYAKDADWEHMVKLMKRVKKMVPGKWYKLNIRCTIPTTKRTMHMQIRRKVLGIYPNFVRFETPYGGTESYTNAEVAMGLDKVPEGTEIITEEKARELMGA